MTTRSVAPKPVRAAPRAGGRTRTTTGTSPAKGTATRGTGVRQAAAQATRDAILRAATKVFAAHGFDGGKLEMISRAAKSYDRMVYYYFGSKEGLYIAVIEDAYRCFNDAESALRLDSAQPEQALRDLVRFVWGYYQRHPEFITLLNTENLLRGRHIAKSLRARDYSSPVLAATAGVLASGVRQGLFRPDLTARDLYLMIAALGYFYLSNRYTLSAFLGEPLDTAPALAHWEGFIVDAVLRTVVKSPR